MIPPGLFITEGEWAIVRSILLRHVPEREVWVFGSRVSGRVKPFSDLDLAVLGDHPLSFTAHADLVEDFTESGLPYKVDLVDWATTSQRFRDLIAAGHVVLSRGAATMPGETQGALGYGV